ncbi:MAG: MerR family DNA-binding protein, partial [Gaiellaceae bacterium]
RLSLIVQARKRGFTLAEVAALVDADGDWREVAEKKLEALKRDKEELDAMIDLLTESLKCGCEVLDICPLRGAEADGALS